MAPISHLLVYYTTPLGEIVGDSISFRVKLQHEKVSNIRYMYLWRHTCFTPFLWEGG